MKEIPKKCKVPNLFYALDRLDMSYTQFAKLVGVSSGNVTDWKNGKSKPSANKVFVIAKEINVPIGWLLYPEKIELEQYIELHGNENVTQNINNGVNNGNIGNNSLLEHNIDPAKVSNPPLNDDVARDEYEKELLAIYRCLSTKEKNALLNKAYELSELFKS